MPTDIELAVAEALYDLNKKRFPSIRAAACEYGLDRSLLRRRAKGSLQKRLAHQCEARLGPRQEEELVK